MSAARTTETGAALALMRARLDPILSAGAAPPSRSDHDLTDPARRSDAASLAPAAVLAPLVERDGELWFVMTVRSGRLKRHAGQISFPGGRMDPADPDLATAALREADEEIGLRPSQVELLGAFDAYETVTGYAVTPFVGLVAGPFEPVPDPSEVSDVFEAPFAFLMNPANHRRACREWRGEDRWFYEMPYGSRYIWGATAGMLKSLHDRLYGAES